MNAPDRVEFMEALAPLFSAYGKPLAFRSDPPADFEAMRRSLGAPRG